MKRKVAQLNRKTLYLNKNVKMQNHIGNGRVRYTVDSNFKSKLRFELNKSILILKSFFKNKMKN